MERRQSQVNLTEDQIEEIAERASSKAVEKMTTQIYTNVGRGILNKLFYVAGAATLGIYFWLSAKGWIK